MSSEDFFGRPMTKDDNFIEFDLCEVCQRRSPNWLEIQYQENLPIIRFTCHECHSAYINSDRQDKTVTRQIDEDEEIEEVVRPGWVDDFINEGENMIQTVDVVETSPNSNNSEVEFSEAPKSFQEPVAALDQENLSFEQPQFASWAPKFIEQALFGPNPEDWLDKQGAYEENNLNTTLVTLSGFANNDISSVKLSAIQCLLGIYKRNAKYKDQVIAQLGNYQIDSDENVANFASQTIEQIKT